MNENELKSIERYFNKFNEDAASFNEFEANDFIKLLKNNNRNDDAIEVGSTFLQMAPSLKGYINQYGYALYNKFINIDDEKIKEKENLFFDILEDIVNICKQEKYSPVEPAINRAIKYALSQTPINYDLMIKMLNKLDIKLLSDKPFVNKEGKEFESFKERYFRLKVRALFETKQYKACVECANQALATPLKWHYNADVYKRQLAYGVSMIFVPLKISLESLVISKNSDIIDILIVFPNLRGRVINVTSEPLSKKSLIIKVLSTK